MPVSIKRFNINNYRSCRQTAIDLNPGLSVLVGTNGSGKTNILNAVLLLNKLLAVRPWTDSPERSEAISKLDVIYEVDQTSIKYKSSVSIFTSHQEREAIRGLEESWHFNDALGGQSLRFPAWFIDVNNDEYRHLEKRVYSRRLLKHDQDPAFTFDVPPERLWPSLQSVRDFVKGIVYYSASQFTNPSECPTYIELENEQLSWRRTQGHEPLLFDMYNASKSERFTEYLSIVGRDGIRLVDTIMFLSVKVPTGQVQVRSGGRIIRKSIKRELIVPIFVIDGIKLSPNQLSEGTFKTLAILFYLITSSSSIVLLEEPEVCVHHGLLLSIVELIKSYSREKQIVVSTHSDFLLDQVEPEQVLLVTKKRRSGTRVQRLPESMSTRGYKALKQYLQASGNLGEYWRQTDFENG